MSNGDELILGELGNAATSTTRLVGHVDGNAVLWIEQQSETNAGEAIVALGGPGRTAIFRFGGNSNTGRGGLAIAGQGGNGVPHDLGGVGVLGSGGGPSDNPGDGVWGITRSSSQAGVFGFNFGLGPGLRGYSAVPTAGQRAHREWCRGRGKERRRQRRTRRGECQPGHRGARRAHRQWSSVGGQRARWLFILWKRDNRRRAGLTDREQSSRPRPRLTAAMILSGSAVQMKGLGSWLASSR